MENKPQYSRTNVLIHNINRKLKKPLVDRSLLLVKAWIACAVL
jgi:hypothetical protein